MRRIVAPALVGAVLVGVAELSLSLLLYAQAGFLRALTVLLGVQLGSLAVGLATAPARSREGEWTAAAAVALRWRWLIAVAALAVAALAAAGWSLLGGLGGSPLQRGVAVMALASFPMLAIGGVLGGLMARSPDLRIGAWVTAGGAVGATLLGTLLITRLIPTSLLLGATVAMSSAALVDGGVDRHDADGATTDAEMEGDEIVPIESLAPDPRPM